MRAIATLLLCLASALLGGAAMLLWLDSQRQVGWRNYLDTAELALIKTGQPIDHPLSPDLLQQARQLCPQLSRATGLSLAEVALAQHLVGRDTLESVDRAGLERAWDTLGRLQRARVAFEGVPDELRSAMPYRLKEDPRVSRVRERMHDLLEACSRFAAESGVVH